MQSNLTPDRRFALALAGTLLMVIVIVWALAPRKMRANVVDTLSKMGPRTSLATTGSSGRSENHTTAAAIADHSREYWPAGHLFEAPTVSPARNWSPGSALVRYVFGENDAPAPEPFLLQAAVSDPSRDNEFSSLGGSSGQPDGGRAGAGNGMTGGRTGAGGGWSGGGSGGTGGGLGSGSSNGGSGGSTPSGSRPEPASLSDGSSHGSDARGGLARGDNSSNVTGSSQSNSKGSSSAPRPYVIALVTGGSASSSGLQDVYLEPPVLNPGSSWHAPGSSSHATQGSGGSGGTGSGGTGTGGSGGSGWHDHQSYGSHPTRGSAPGQTQGAAPESGPTGDPQIAYSQLADLDTSDLPTGDPTPVPEPGAWVLLLTALAGIVALKPRFARQA